VTPAHDVMSHTDSSTGRGSCSKMPHDPKLKVMSFAWSRGNNHRRPEGQVVGNMAGFRGQHKISDMYETKAIDR
jgi:hypothetical protein